MQAAKVQELIEALFGKLGLDMKSIKMEQLTEKEWYCNVVSADEILLLSSHGEVTRSFQHVLKTIIRCQGWLEDGEVLKFDIGEYRKKQEANVLRMAEEKADQVTSSGQGVLLPPMSPYFRRIVHLFVAEKFPKLISSSEGAGEHRSVRIARK